MLVISASSNLRTLWFDYLDILWFKCKLLKSPSQLISFLLRTSSTLILTLPLFPKISSENSITHQELYKDSGLDWSKSRLTPQFLDAFLRIYTPLWMKGWSK